MDLHKPIRLPSLIACFMAASLLLYLGMAMYLLLPGGYRQSRLEMVFPLLLFVLPSLGLSYRIAWLLRRHDPDQSTFRDLRLTLPLSLAAVIAGAILVSMAILRGHWIELFWGSIKELF